MASLIISNEKEKSIIQMDKIVADIWYLILLYLQKRHDKKDTSSLHSFANILKKISDGWKRMEKNTNNMRQLGYLFRLETVNLYAIFEESLRNGGVWNIADLYNIIDLTYKLCNIYESGEDNFNYRFEPLVKVVKSIERYTSNYLEKRIIREGGI
jgi:hypothetical protein